MSLQLLGLLYVQAKYLYIKYLGMCTSHFESLTVTNLTLQLAKCIDPYVDDDATGQCSLDTDGDMIPDYRVSKRAFYSVVIIVLLSKQEWLSKLYS